ncbi:MAG: hypothetical protein U0641_05995 [Anaerolineae bacterium]
MCNQSAWTTGRNAASGSTANATSAANANWVGVGCTTASILGTSNVNLSRGFLVFDTSALPDNAVISGAAVYVYVTGKSLSKNDGAAFVSIVQGAQASPTTLTTADYNKAGAPVTNPTEGSNRLDIASIGPGGYARWDLNPAGLGWLSKTAPTKLALREGHDIVNAWPSFVAGQGNYISAYLSEQAGTSQDPYIDITYTLAPVTSTPTATSATAPTNTPTPTATNTPLPPTSTPTATNTPTNTPLPPTSTPTATTTSTPTPTATGAGATTVRFYATQGDGSAGYTSTSSFSNMCNQSAWTTGRNAASGSTANATSAANANWVGVGCTPTNILGTSNVNLSRGFLVFDTSALPDNAVISGAAVYVYVTGKSLSKNDGAAFVSIVQGAQASPTTLTTADYNKAGAPVTNPTEGSNRLDIASIGPGGYARWDLNPAGLGWLSKTAPTKLALREGHDIVNAWPSFVAGQGNYISAYLSEQAGTSQDPYVDITYTLGP